MQAQLAQDGGGVATIAAAISDSRRGLDADAAEVWKPAVRASSTAQHSGQQHVSAQCMTLMIQADAV
jgi:hypothetical protein